LAKGKELGAHEPKKVPASAVLQRMQRAFLFGSGLWSLEEANCSWDACNWGQRSSGKDKEINRRKKRKQNIQNRKTMKTIENTRLLLQGSS
jgi:hypothetical protein